MRTERPLPAEYLPRDIPEVPPHQLNFDIPLPPFVNRLTARLGNSSITVRKWINQADRFLWTDFPRLKRCAIHGPFALHITWTSEEVRRSGIDNRIQILMDYLERVELIGNDRDCRFLTVCYGEAPQGCRVLLRPWLAV